MIESVLGKSVAANLSTGGTVDGDLTVTGSLGVGGDVSINLTSVVSNSTIIDATGTEALLVRKNGDGGDVFVVYVSAFEDIVFTASGAAMGSQTERLRIADDGLATFSGNLALSATSPQINFSGSAGDYGTFGYTEGDPDVFKWGLFQNSGQLASITIDAVSEASPSARFRFNVGGDTDTALMIDSSKRIGIGGTPDTLLHLQGNNGNASHTLLKIHNNDVTSNTETGQTADIEFNFQGTTNGGSSFVTKNAGAIRAGKDSDYFTSSALALTLSSDQSATFAGDILVANATPSLSLQDTDGTNQISELLTSGATTYLSLRNGSSHGSLVIRGYNGSVYSTALTIDSSQNATFSGEVNVEGGILTIGKADTASGHINAFENMSFNIDIDNDDTNRFFEFSINGSSGAGTELMRLTEDGRLGIGASSPEADIAFEPDVYTTGNQGIRWQDPVVDTDAIVQGVRQASNVGIGVFIGANSQVDTSGAISRFNTSEESSFISVDPRGDLLFGTSGTGANPSTRMTIDSSGNVGIGASPLKNFSIADDNSFSNSDGHISMNVSPSVSLNESAGIAFGTFNNDDYWKQGIFWKRTGSYGLGELHLAVRSTADTTTVSIADTALKFESNKNATFAGAVTVSGGNLNVDGANRKILVGESGLSGGAFGHIGWNDSGDYLYIGHSYSSAFNADIVVVSGGHVGIGTTSPITGSSKTVLTISDSAQSLLVFEDTGYESSGDGLGMFAYNDGTLTYRTASRSGTDFTGSTNRLVIDANSRISLSNNDSGTSNTLFGKTAGDSDGAGDFNVFVGELSGGTGTQTDDADGNVGVGYRALTDVTSGNQNVAIGKDALTNITSGDSNIGIGSDALGIATTAEDVVVIGRNAGYAINNDSADGTIAIGRNALTALTSGEKNTAIGFESAKSVLQGNRNTALGYQALDALAGDDGNNGGSDNIAIGVDAMGSLNAGVHNDARANSNIAIGNSAFLAGSMADTGASVSQGNVAIGHEAIMSTGVTPHVGTTAVGFRALKNLTSGSGNLAVGYLSLTTNGTGSYNTAVGYEALTSLPDGGSQNTAIGWKALHGATSSACDNLTAIGYKAGFQISTGFNNTLIGANVDVNTGNFDNVTAIGNNFEATSSDSVFLGNANVTDVYMAVDSGATVHCAGVNLSGGILTFSADTELTISSGAVTATRNYHTLDTEGGAGTDDLDTINGGSDGQLLILRDDADGRDVTAKDGTGNLALEGDFTFTNSLDTLTLLYCAGKSKWLEISRSNNA